MTKKGKNMNRMFTKTKRGGASMFIVMFTIIILSIITLSFTRLVLAEATKTSNTDLSQSAYDSALAGIEDAKIAILRYHACIDQGYTRNSGGECGDIIRNMQDGIKDNDCSTVQKVLKREQDSENNSVVIQETQSSTDAGNNANMLQAYTCVTIKEDLEDYRTTLTSSSRLRIIPIRSANINNIGFIQLKWFSRANLQHQKDSGLSGSNGYNFCDKTVNTFYPSGICENKQQSPPVITARLIQTDKEFDLSELSVSKASDQTDTGQMTFIPTLKGDNYDSYYNASSWGESANKGENQAKMARCFTAREWICTISFQIPKTFNGSDTNRNEANTYLLISMPYGSPESDVSVSMYNKNGITAANRYDFTGVQARVDSTGRANDLYRRVEARIELVDTYFAYPEFEITMTGSGNDVINKSFYTTLDCFSAENGVGKTCNNSGEVNNN